MAPAEEAHQQGDCRLEAAAEAAQTFLWTTLLKNCSRFSGTSSWPLDTVPLAVAEDPYVAVLIGGTFELLVCEDLGGLVHAPLGGSQLLLEKKPSISLEKPLILFKMEIKI
ncbi:hypothetical protein HPP92_027441 [Vanilla planifolia]|uniref:Uncharacterized protein n=1 Tax=Vanilla planifolia TaxID=51239 RepID=A0A835U4G5_VANPL|nr:hypothetical protein HPP92_027441 [Vanilla planifolia]KAG0449229.1 hypothetical protein HPP92_027468 [Vanilla planifolia]KAG0476977.1 hypothetical protein HPP92_013818 [Vanilla planifolia]